MTIHQMSKRFSWLHFSGFQFGSRSSPAYEKARRALFADLGFLHEHLGPWHAVFVTGDIASSGKEEEYGQAAKAFKDLLEHLGELGSTPRILTVPGNHDIDRAHLSDSDIRSIRYVDEDAEWAEELWETGSPLREAVEKSFRPYTEWAERLSFTIKKKRSGKLPGDWSATIPGEGCKVAVIGLNSAFVQLADGEYYGHLTLSPAQIRALWGKEPDEWLGEHNAALLLTTLRNG